MSKAKFTPGPWRQEAHQSAPEVFIRNEKGLLASVYAFFAKGSVAKFDTIELKANAALIAAAPAMYKALEYYTDVLDEARGKAWRDSPDHVLRKILQALALARGEQPKTETP